MTGISLPNIPEREKSVFCVSFHTSHSLLPVDNEKMNWQHQVEHGTSILIEAEPVEEEDDYSVRVLITACSMSEQGSTLG